MFLLRNFLKISIIGVIFLAGCCCIFWFWITYESIPNAIIPISGLSFHYIIVGAGTTGSVLANKLSENPNISVLLIEAGHNFGPLSKIPLLTTVIQKSKYDWSFMSVPQKYSSKGLINQMQSLPRGKGLGGSSQINYMLHFGGNQKDFDKWNAMGINGWNMKSSKKKQKPKTTCLKNSCGIYKKGDITYSLGNEFYYEPVKHNQTKLDNDIWSIHENYSSISQAFVKTSSMTEFHNLTFKLAQYNIKNGMRWSVFQKYLRPTFKRSNLNILPDTMVKKIVIEEKRAKSVLVIDPSRPKKKVEIFAEKEIILAAGTYQTPQILQVSGIGPKSVLNRIGVEQVIDSPNVGSNLHDHLNLPLFVSINVSASITVDKVLSVGEIFRYLLYGKGIFANFGVIGSISSKDNDFGVTMFGTGAVDESALMEVSNFRREVFRSLFPLHHNHSQEGFVLLSTCYHPQSRGHVHAKSTKIKDIPHIDPNYLEKQYDVSCMIKGVRSAVNVIKSQPFQQLNATIHWPRIKECLSYGPYRTDFITNEPSDSYLECIIRMVGLTGQHPGGTSSMGATEDSVLDHKLRVRGVKRLRIIDASVLPTPLSGTPNSVLIAMAKKAAKLIQETYYDFL